MLISCEKCSTTYVLDDKLIPAQGAPVQCTRCGHVFTARPPGPEAAAAPAPASNSTQMFGAPGTGSAPAAPAATNKTVMFGVGGAEAPPPSQPSSAANRTMMFGALGADNPAPPKDAPANRTMMFGAPSDVGSAPPNPNKTMMFGAAGADNAAPPAAQGPVPGAANPRSTMMFGAPSGLGGAAPAPAPAQQKTSQTMMFGTPAAAPPQAPAPGQQKTSQTMMFGTPAAPPQPAAPAQQKTSSTMMFGTPVAAPPAAAAPPAQQKSSSTMIFGATPVVPPGPGKSPKLTESTVRIGPEDLERMMREHDALGRDGGMTPPEGAPASPAQDRQNKTQMFAMSDQAEGATPAGGSDAVARQNKTQMFAMGDLPEVTEPSAGPAGAKRPGRPAPGARADGSPRYDPSILDTFPPDGQQRGAAPNPEGVHTLLMPGSGGAGAPADRAARPPSSTLQYPAHDPGGSGAVADDGAGRVDLPPEAPDLMRQSSPISSNGATQPVSPVEADPAAALRASVARRNRIALILISLVLVAAALGVTWKVFGKMLLNRAPPAAAIEGCEKALGQLRFDDSKAKEAAVAQLTTLVATYPDYVEGHAALVTAVSLQLDDVQQRVRRIEQLVERKNSLIARYNKDKSPANWETTAQQLSAQVDELIKEHKPLSEEGHALDTKAREAYKGLDSAVSRVGEPSKQAKLAAVRAQALFHGVSGTEQALVLTKRYESLAEGAAPDGWIDLAIPEYAANARVSEELMTQALAKLEELHKRDSTFLRTYVLSARIHLIRKELEAATTDLDQVLSMRKDHDVAAELREWVRKLSTADEKKQATP